MHCNLSIKQSFVGKLRPSDQRRACTFYKLAHLNFARVIWSGLGSETRVDATFSLETKSVPPSDRFTKGDMLIGESIAQNNPIVLTNVGPTVFGQSFQQGLHPLSFDTATHVEAANRHRHFLVPQWQMTRTAIFVLVAAATP